VVTEYGAGHVSISNAEGVPAMGYGRAIALGVLALVAIPLGDLIALLLTALASGSAPGCGSGGDPNSCPDTLSGGAVDAIGFGLFVVVWLSFAFVVWLLLGRRGIALGFLRVLGLSAVPVLATVGVVALGLYLARSVHAGSSAWWISVSLAIAAASGWAILVRWIVNRSGMGDGKDSRSAAQRAQIEPEL
jgi:hypothetical protein